MITLYTIDESETYTDVYLAGVIEEKVKFGSDIRIALDSESPDYYSVYLRKKDGTSICIGDTLIREQGEKLLKICKSLLVLL